MPSATYEFAVIGGGIIGLATARELLNRGATRLLLLESEPTLCAHQTSRNSGVVHAGLYYKPNSLKARLCLQGLHLSYEYFAAKNIPHRKVGKIVVATNPSQLASLQRLYQNALTNKVPDITYLDTSAKIKQLEPESAGIAAIHSPHTGIVDWSLVAHHFADDIRSQNGVIQLNSPVSALHKHPNTHHITLSTPTQTFTADRVITCTGAQSDRVAQLLGGAPSPQIIPVRGEYLRVTNKEIADRIRGNIYPVPPDPAGPDGSAPFLGVHFTRTMHGEVLVGPNAVLALSRRGYTPYEINLRDMWDMVSYAGFWRLGFRNSRFALRELYKSWDLRAAVAEARELVPGLKDVRDFERRGVERSGIRGQGVDLNGGLVDDFVFEGGGGGRVLHVRNAPSPGATASLGIAKVVVDKCEQGEVK